MPSGVFSMLHGDDRTIGAALLSNLQVKALGFTGSIPGGCALYDIGVSLLEPIIFMVN
jgi:alpha-ketoglutaric semialdehyde dehydrogenase